MAAGCFSTSPFTAHRKRGYRETYNQLDGVAKGGIQQAAHGLAEANGDFLGGKGQDGGEGDNGKEVDGEDSGGAPARGAGNDANGDGDEEEVDIVWFGFGSLLALLLLCLKPGNSSVVVSVGVSDKDVLLSRVTLVTCQV